MKTTRWVLSYALVMMCLSSFGQDYAFKVLMNKGTNEVKSGSAWQQVKTGASLKPGDEVKIADNAYLGLMHVSGKPLELTKAGTFKVADLASKVSGGSSVLNKYTDFILSSNSPEAKKNRLSATGAVDRGGKNQITLLLPSNQFSGTVNDKVILNWETEVKGPYLVVLQNMFDDVLDTREVNDNFLEINLSDPKLSNNDLNAVLVEVFSKADPAISTGKDQKKMIKRLSAEENKKFKTLFGEFAATLSEETAINKFALANFYEQNNLLVDAATAYQEAIKLEPAYKEAYEEFLLRTGIKKGK
jgi:hypothetical protein